jgi:pyridoxine 4-dehydrogenase
VEAPAARIQLPPIGLGAWSWGDSVFWGYDRKNDDDLRAVFDYAMATSNVTLVDTAEIYGFGRSETLVGQFSSQYPDDKVVIATKFAALPFRTSARDVVKACRDSLKRLGRSSIDLYQIHFPNAWSNAEYWDGLAECVDQGLVKAVGVSNYGVEATRACHAALQKRGIPLSTNQLQLSLLYRYPLENGLLSCCQDLGIQVLSYSPLALGMLAGKYTPASPPGGPRKAIYEKLMSTGDYGNLLSIMKDVAAVRPGATLSQVAINWAIAKNTVPIPGARTLSQVQQNYQSLSWSLSPAEERALDVAASKVSTFLGPDNAIFVKEDINAHLRMFDS